MGQRLPHLCNQAKYQNTFDRLSCPPYQFPAIHVQASEKGSPKGRRHTISATLPTHTKEERYGAKTRRRTLVRTSAISEGQIASSGSGTTGRRRETRGSPDHWHKLEFARSEDDAVASSIPPAMLRIRCQRCRPACVGQQVVWRLKFPKEGVSVGSIKRTRRSVS